MIFLLYLISCEETKVSVKTKFEKQNFDFNLLRKASTYILQNSYSLELEQILQEKGFEKITKNVNEASIIIEVDIKNSNKTLLLSFYRVCKKGTKVLIYRSVADSNKSFNNKIALEAFRENIP